MTNLAESFKEGYGSKRAVLSLIMMEFILSWKIREIKTQISQIIELEYSTLSI
jgi:hypothetical protein